jgi:3-keto-disaccharide hydrolase
MRRFAILLAVLAVGTAAAQEKKTPAPAKAPPKPAPVVPPRQGQSETIKLFDGKTLAGWEGYPDLWSVKDGVIVARNDKPLKFSTYLLTKDKYTDFRLTFAAKLVESEMHSGVAFWGEVRPSVSKDPEKDRTKYTYAGHLVMFPSGWGMYDLFGREGRLGVDGGPARKVGKQHDWNDIEILAQGNRVRVAANGHAVVDWRDPEPKRIKEGPIGLQLHSNTVPQEIHFKGLVLTTFPEQDRLMTVKDGGK